MTGTHPPTGTHHLPVGDAAGEVDAVVAAALDGVPASLREPCRRVALAGGKRLRAGLVLAANGDSRAAAGAGRSWAPSPPAVTAAAAVELLHLATLVHDDLLDDAPVRRGVPTINAQEGTGAALLAGDLLIGLAGRLASAVDGRVRALLDEALVDLCAGQALEADHRWDADVTADTVLRTATLKTGTLLGVACEIGGHLGGAADPAGLRGYGLEFGTVLQLVDDLLDLLSDEPTYGKPTGVDFPAGTVTLPAVHGLAASPGLRPLLRPGLDPADRRRAGDLLRAGPGIAATLAEVRHRAGWAADRLPPGATLAGLPGRYVTRQMGLVLPQHRHLLPPTGLCGAATASGPPARS